MYLDEHRVRSDGEATYFSEPLSEHERCEETIGNECELFGKEAMIEMNIEIGYRNCALTVPRGATTDAGANA